MDNSDQNIDYDDLLPLDNVHGTESNEYEDLLPPLDVSQQNMMIFYLKCHQMQVQKI